MSEWQQKMNRFGSAGRITGLLLLTPCIVGLLLSRINSPSSAVSTETPVGLTPTSISVESALTETPRPPIILDHLFEERKTLEVKNLLEHACDYRGDAIQVQGYITKRPTNPNLMSNPYRTFDKTEVTVYDLFANLNGDFEPVEVRIEDKGFVYPPLTRVSIIGGVRPDETNGKKDYCYVSANSIRALSSK